MKTTSYKLPAGMTTCPNCGVELTAICDVHAAPRKPQKGDLSVCSSCATALTIDPGMKLRPMTHEEKAKLENENPAAAAMLILAMGAAKQAMENRKHTPKTQFQTRFLDSGREATNEPNPDFPEGVSLDLSNGAALTCAVELPYPAPRIGVMEVRCLLCGIQAGVTVAGLADDAARVRLPCQIGGTKQ